jgi:hypothetical protein
MKSNFIYFTSWTMHACLSSYAHVSQIIWLNFTQETKKYFKLQEDECKLKILSLRDEALIETIKMDRWNTWFGARTRKLWHFKNARGCKTGGSDLVIQRVRFSWIRRESESNFLLYLVRIFQFMKRTMSSHLYICTSCLIVTCHRYNQSINRYFIFFNVIVNVDLLLSWISLLSLTHLHRR